MTTAYEIPLSAEAQKFTIALAGQDRQLRVYWNKWSENWVLDLNQPDGTPLLQGLPIVTGADILGQYEHLGLGGSIVAQTDFDLDAVPTFENLGNLGRVYFLVE